MDSLAIWEIHGESWTRPVELLVHTIEGITSFHLGSGNVAQAPAGSLTPLSWTAQWGVEESPVRTRGATGAVELKVRTLGQL